MLRDVRKAIEQGQFQGPVKHDIQKRKNIRNNTWCATPLREHTDAEKRISEIIHRSDNQIETILQSYARDEARLISGR